MFFEAQINNLNFRYSGGNIIEVSKVGDKQRNVLHEIWVQELTNKKAFRSAFKVFNDTLEEFKTL